MLCSVKEHEKWLYSSRSFAPDAKPSRLAVVATREEDLSRQLLRSALLRVKVAVLPVETRHADHIDLVYRQRGNLEVLVHIEALY